MINSTFNGNSEYFDKNIFSHKLVRSDKKNLKSIKTNDTYGLFKFLLLCDGSYKIKRFHNAHLLKDLIDVKKN